MRKKNSNSTEERASFKKLNRRNMTFMVKQNVPSSVILKSCLWESPLTSKINMFEKYLKGENQEKSALVLISD